MSTPQEQHPGQTPADYDEYGDEPRQDKPADEQGNTDKTPLEPDEPLTDLA